MTAEQETPRVVSASREIAAGAARIFDLIADPAAQPGWDGNDNLASAPAGQRVRRTGDVFAMTLTRGEVRENQWWSSRKADGSPGRLPSQGRHRRGTCGAGNSSRPVRLAPG
jgi:hypothetical protein